MNLHTLLRQREAQQRPLRIGLIGAGKFGSMYLSQARATPGIQMVAVADLSPDRARAALQTTGWPAERFAAASLAEAVKRGTTHVTDDVAGMVAAPEIEIVIDATGNPSAGKGTKYLPAYHASTPDTVWSHYGLSADDAKLGGLNARMFNSFLDGTKSAIEMAAVANATGLAPAPDGLEFPPCGVDDLPRVLRPSTDGGRLHHSGQVEVVSSLEREGAVLDGEGGYTVYGKLMPAADSLRLSGLPLGLAHGVTLKRAIAAGQPVKWADVAIDETNVVVRFRREMERVFAPGGVLTGVAPAMAGAQ